jgi:hypothetical protein
MDNTKMLGRGTGETSAEARAETRHRLTATVEYCSGATGDARVDLFESVDDANRGGVVLRLSVKDGGSSFVPHAVVHPEGVDIHLAGDAEAEAFLLGLERLLATIPRHRTEAMCSVKVTLADRMDHAESWRPFGRRAVADARPGA